MTGGQGPERRKPRCPTCKEALVQSEDGARGANYPFCSERCRWVDLGRWLDEEYRVSRPLGPDEHTH